MCLGRHRHHEETENETADSRQSDAEHDPSSHTNHPLPPDVLGGGYPPSLGETPPRNLRGDKGSLYDNACVKMGNRMEE